MQHHVYSAFGKLLKVEDGNGNDVTDAPVLDPYFTFTGREYDKETGLYYYRARLYDPALGRFLTVDPHPGEIIAPVTVTNRYIYAGNNSTNITDPSGEGWFDDMIGTIAGYSLGAMAWINPASLLASFAVISVFDPMIGLSLTMVSLEFAMSPINLMYNGEFTYMQNFHGHWMVRDSFFANDRSFSTGAVSFIRPGDGERVMKHEYGHYLQYKSWGGWGFAKKYLDAGWGNTGNPLEMNADVRASAYFGENICSYAHLTHPNPACRY